MRVTVDQYADGADGGPLGITLHGVE